MLVVLFSSLAKIERVKIGKIIYIVSFEASRAFRGFLDDPFAVSYSKTSFSPKLSGGRDGGIGWGEYRNN